MMSSTELGEIFAYCKEKGIHCYVTMHTVVPLPTLPEYLRFRLLRPFGGKLTLTSVPKGLALLAFQIWEDCIWLLHLLLRGNLRLWKRWNSLKEKVSTKTSQDKAQKIFPQGWQWTRENPDYDMGSYLHFRTSQKTIVQSAEKIVVHCTEAKEALQNMGANSIEVIPHGVLFAPTSPHRHSHEDGKTHVGCFGFMHPHKCLLEIIDACAQVPNLSLHIYASTEHCGLDDRYRRQVERKANQHEWIELCTDHLELDEVIWKLSACDVNVWFADVPGGMSVSGSIRQYIAAGRPIIASDTIMISDIRDAVEVVPPQDVHALAQVLSQYREANEESSIKWAVQLAWEKVTTPYTRTPSPTS
tara:strand:- start:476 stop:1549 length:1074 start_codon:yes stop_codon:yes gene_type:complete